MKRLTLYLIPFEEFQERYDDNSTEECIKEENLGTGFTRRQVSPISHGQGMIVANDNDESLLDPMVRNPEGKHLKSKNILAV